MPEPKPSSMRRRPIRLDTSGLWDYAIKSLGTRDYSIAELQRKLATRADRMTVDSVVAKLREYGYLNDQRFASSYAAARLTSQKFGPQRVLRDLRGKQIPASVAQQAVSDTFAAVDEAELACAFLERKFRGKDLRTVLRDEKTLASAYRKLRLGGFSPATSIGILRLYAARAEELEGVEEGT